MIRGGLLVAVLMLAGCSTPVRLNNTTRLMARPDAEAARKAAPEWCADALITIAELEAQLESK